MPASTSFDVLHLQWVFAGVAIPIPPDIIQATFFISEVLESSFSVTRVFGDSTTVPAEPVERFAITQIRTEEFER